MLLNKNHIEKTTCKQKILKNFLEKQSGKWARRQKKDKTERAMGVGRRTREEIVKWNEMTALRFIQDGGRGH